MDSRQPPEGTRNSNSDQMLVHAQIHELRRLLQEERAARRYNELRAELQAEKAGRQADRKEQETMRQMQELKAAIETQMTRLEHASFGRRRRLAYHPDRIYLISPSDLSHLMSFGRTRRLADLSDRIF